MELADDEFCRFYHMERTTLASLTSFLNPQVRVYQGGRVQLRPHKIGGMTLFYLGSRLPYLQLATLFGVSEECFIRSTTYIMDLLNQKCKDVIKWPQKEDYENISGDFNKTKRRQFPNIIGAIDGCHIRISPKCDEIQSHRNFKSFHSIHFQAICLSDRRFTDIFVG